ncbi:MAG: hypothetical protein R3B72_49595 [Polyangiaceae bacterium]
MVWLYDNCESPPPDDAYELAIAVEGLPSAAVAAVITAGTCTSPPPAGGTFTVPVKKACDGQPLHLTGVPDHCDQVLGEARWQLKPRRVAFSALRKKGRICVTNHAKSALAKAFVTIDDSPRMAAGDDGCIEVPLGCDSRALRVTIGHESQPEPITRELDFSKSNTQHIAFPAPASRRVTVAVVNAVREPVPSATVTACNIESVLKNGSLTLALPHTCTKPAKLTISAPSFKTITLTEDELGGPVVLVPTPVPCTQARCAKVRAAARSLWPGQTGTCQCHGTSASCSGAFGQGSVAASCQCQGSCSF